MFMGQYRHSLDEKGRLTIPARYRDMLMDGAYITQGFDHNLMVWPAAVFQVISQRISQMRITDSDSRLLRRLIFSNGEQVEVDKAGRILIAQFLRETSDLHGDAVVVGAGDYFEIWSPKSWEDQMEELKNSDANAMRFAAFDLSSS
jgi:MraZ protein